MDLIKTVGVTKIFGKQAAVRNAEIHIGNSEIYGLIGPSGAGKTTLIKLIVGMLEADKGEIKVLDIRMPNLDVLQEIGYMIQSDALYSGLTGEENLNFFASLFGLDKTKKKERIAYTSNLVFLNKELKKRVAAYSGGMKRRLSLAIALIQDPKILILDEPTIGIDPELRMKIWTEFRRFKKEEGKTILVTTHVMEEAAKCDKLAMIRNGNIIAEGSPAELKKQYRVTDLDEVFLKAGKDKNEN